MPFYHYLNQLDNLKQFIAKIYFPLKFDYQKTLIVVVSVLFIVKIIIVYIFQNEIGVWEDDVIARNMLETGEMFYMQRGTPNYMFQFPVIHHCYLVFTNYLVITRYMLLYLIFL